MVKNFPEMPNYDEYKFTIWAKVKANGYGYSYGWMLVQDALDCTIGGWNGGDYNIYIRVTKCNQYVALLSPGGKFLA